VESPLARLLDEVLAVLSAGTGAAAVGVYLVPESAPESAPQGQRGGPRLERFVPTHAGRIELLDHVYCEARRDPKLRLPPDLVLALIEVESRFDRSAVSPSGAVGLMQVMPFWPLQLGASDELVEVAPNIRIGCEILRYYLRAEHHDWSRALARYNGSAGREDYPQRIMSRWHRAWRVSQESGTARGL